MNFNLYKEYHFFKSKLTSIKNGKSYTIHLDKNDRFYSYLKPHLTTGKVSALTKLMIDKLTVEDTDRTFLNEDYFSLNTTILAKDSNDTFYAYELSIKKLKINRINVTKQSYENSNSTLSLCEMEIPYLTDINVVLKEQ